ncbi:hypothetical protein HDU92_000319 [Lobulomyces angularis]|nr:hypothetical protein HDU92_000319 [Lobulomyces angularis]
MYIGYAVGRKSGFGTVERRVGLHAKRWFREENSVSATLIFFSQQQQLKPNDLNIFKSELLVSMNTLDISVLNKIIPTLN